MLPLLGARVFQSVGNARVPFSCATCRSFPPGPVLDTPLSRRCHFQDPQYHFLGLRVSVGKVNVYKVEARLNRDLTVSRPWHIFVLLTEVDTRLLCAINHSPVASRTSLSHEPDKQCVPTPASTRSTIATIPIVARAAQAASQLCRASRSQSFASAIPYR
jgi:hypothetical protein